MDLSCPKVGWAKALNMIYWFVRNNYFEFCLSVIFKIHPWASTNHYLPLNHLSFMCCFRWHGMELIRQKRSLFWHDKNIMKFLLPSSHNLIKSQWICLLWRQGEGGHQTELTGVCNNFLCIYECNWIKSYFSLVL